MVRISNCWDQFILILLKSSNIFYSITPDHTHKHIHTPFVSALTAPTTPVFTHQACIVFPLNFESVLVKE